MGEQKRNREDREEERRKSGDSEKEGRRKRIGG